MARKCEIAQVEERLISGRELVAENRLNQIEIWKFIQLLFTLNKLRGARK